MQSEASAKVQPIARELYELFRTGKLTKELVAELSERAAEAAGEHTYMLEFLLKYQDHVSAATAHDVPVAV